jgi:formylmethanofuran dehydrogenase subunit E
MDHHTHAGCKYYNLSRDCSLADLAAFHGHLGPYIVLGYRIGRYVRDNFCDDPFRMKALVYCSGTPPQSCLVDGVQLGSGCTLGKRSIEIIPSDTLRCDFEVEGRRLSIRPRPIQVPERDEHYDAAIESIAERMYALPDEDLFEIAGP